MTGSEVFASFWNVLLNGHLGITKPDQFHLPIFLCQHGRLLGRAWRRLWLVVAGELLASVVIIWSWAERTTQLESSQSKGRPAYRRGQTRTRWPASALLA